MTEYEEWIKELREGPKPWPELLTSFISWPVVAALALCYVFWALLLGWPLW